MKEQTEVGKLKEGRYVVIDVENPNRLVITPIRQTIYEEPPEDPWTVKFFEGQRSYYFRVDTSFIKSYTITIKVPQEYL